MRKYPAHIQMGMPRKGRSSLYAIGLMLATPVAPISVQAAEDATARSRIEEITVTASRREETLQNTALAVVAADPQEFAAGGLTTIADIVSYSPGVFFRGGSTPTDNGITIRGVSTFTSSPTVGIYVDDIPIGSGSGQASGASLVMDFMKAGMERVEIVKGPQGTSFGASSMGGLLRYVSGDPSKGDLSGAVSVDMSRTDHSGDTNQRYTGKLSAPFGDGRFGVSLSGYYEDVGGFIDRLPAAVGGAAKDVNGHENYGGMFKFVANITDNFSASLLGIADYTTFEGSNIVALDGPPFSPANGKYETDTAISDNESDFELIGLTLNYDFGPASLISSTSYQERYVGATTDLIVDFGSLVRALCGPTCDVSNAPYTGWYSTDRFVQEVRLVSREAEKAAGNFEWSIGAIYSEEESGAGQRLLGLPVNFLALDVNIPSVLEERAAFANLTYYLTDKFDLGVGVRVGKIEASVAIDDVPELIVSDTPPTVIDDTIDTYSFTARYRPTDALSLYGRVASGYRPAAANTPLQGASPIIETDTLWSYELGAKGYLADGRLSYDLAAWYLNWKNLQARVYVNGAQTGGNANSDVTAYGFEAGMTYSPFNNFSLTASFAYTNSELDDDETSAFGALAGENLPLIPEITAALRATQLFQIGSSVEGRVGLGVRYTDQQDTGFEGGVGGNGAVITPLIANFVVEDRFVTDFNLGFDFGNVDLSFYVTNLFDEYGYNSGTARPMIGFIRATASVIEPRTFGGILRVKF